MSQFLTKIQHKGKEIYFFDYTPYKNNQKLIQKLRESADLIKDAPEPILSLNDFTGTFASQEFMNESQRLNKEVFDRQIKKGAIIGITGIKKILLDAYNKLARRQFKACKTKEEALEYLVS